MAAKINLKYWRTKIYEDKDFLFYFILHTLSDRISHTKLFYFYNTNFLFWILI